MFFPQFLGSDKYLLYQLGARKFDLQPLSFHIALAWKRQRVPCFAPDVQAAVACTMAKGVLVSQTDTPGGEMRELAFPQ